MQFEVSEEERKKAKIPHDLFLVNLIGNHILMFVSTLGLATSWIWPMFLVPAVSFMILAYIIYRGKKSKQRDSWFVMCHWQMALRRSLFFIKMLILLCIVVLIGWYGYTNLGWMKEAVYALTGGVAILPVMVTVLVLIIMESDSLHSAGHGKLPDSMLEKYPNTDVIRIDE